MNTLKGLIVKDLLNLKSYVKSIVLMFIFIGFMSIGNINVSYIITMTSVLCGMLVIATFSYDEMTNTNRYLLTFPTSKKEIIKAKYILNILFAIIGVIVGLVTITAFLLIKKEFANIDLKTILMASLLGLFVNCLMTSIQIPNIIKHGAEKGRIYLFLIMAVIIMFFMGGGYLLDKIGIELDGQGITKFLIDYIYIFIPALIVMIYRISYTISSKIFMKKEF